ncbi:uncharacterized protein [Cherax quadricarinatus]|nr:uncharacterized protein LOC128694988 [Cherax quadricarinatus]
MLSGALNHRGHCYAGLVASFVVPVAAALTRVETSMCGKTDTLAECVVKQGQCSPLDDLLAPLLGTPDLITACANTTGVPLNSDYYESIGKAVVTGVSASNLMRQPTSDSVANLAIRRCVLNATHMLGADGSLLDRGAVVTQVSLLSPPDLGAAVAAAATTCPEPTSLKTTGFIQCLKKACMTNAPGSTVTITSSEDY